MNDGLLIIPAAYLLDLVFGDPQWFPHPVRLIGRLIEKLEIKLNPCKNIDRRNKRFFGVVLVVLVVGLTISCVWGILKLSKFIHPFFYYSVCAVLIYFMLSIRDLAVEVNKVYDNLASGNIPKARDSLSLIVGRDTKGLNEPEIIRATVETVAESTMDGIIAPLFYAFLGGAVLGWIYKAINTLDSMVGYKSERFIDFGKASARLDALMNFLPAKITCFLIGTSSLCCGKDWLNSFKWGLRYLFKGQKVNSDATEAAMAGALGIQLGGVNFYNSTPVRKAFIGDDVQSLSIKHIKESMQIAYICSFLFILIGLVISLYLTGRR